MLSLVRLRTWQPSKSRCQSGSSARVMSCLTQRHRVGRKDTRKGDVAHRNRASEGVDVRLLPVLVVVAQASRFDVRSGCHRALPVSHRDRRQTECVSGKALIENAAAWPA